MEPINWGDFKAQLDQNEELHLEFHYNQGSLVDASYHITEIKLATVTSVDCGGVMNKWTEVIMQLWEPGEKQTERSMKVSKALSIIKVVENMLPLDDEAAIKIEFRNSVFDTRQMFPTALTAEGDTLTVYLSPDLVQCKAQTRGGTCGTEEKSKLQMVNLAASSSACCTPGGGCC